MNRVVAIFAWIASVAMLPVIAGEMESQQSAGGYLIQPGDVLHISVWREPDLESDVVVSPDSRLSMPLLGEIDTDGKGIEQLRGDIVARIQRFVPDADVTLTIKQPLGNKIYVIGKVNRPGEYVLNRSVDVMQALSMAAGVAKFADVDDVKILRRSGAGQQVFPFDYSEVEAGERLEQNIVLKPGDIVVVP